MSRPFTSDELDAVLARGHVKIAEARVVKLMDDEGRKYRPEKPHKPAKSGTPRGPRQKWDYEQRLAQQLEAAGVSGFFVDAEYIEGRNLRADVLFIEQRLVVEIQGAVHRIRETWAKDIEKQQATMLAGYRLLPIATKQVRDGSAVEVVKRVLGEVMR